MKKSEAGEVVIMRRKKRVLAEELIKVSRKFRKMFLEQAVEDLGEVPSELAGDEEVVNVDVEELGQEAYGDSVQNIVQAIQDVGVENVEAEGVTTFVVEKDGKKITFEIGVIEGEPVVVIYNEEGRITVSLAPLIGYVTEPEDAVEKIANDEKVVQEFSDLVADVVGVEGEAEEVEWVGDVEGEEGEEEEVEEEDIEGKVEEEDIEGGVEEEDIEGEEMDLEVEDEGVEGEEEEEREEDERVSESRLRRRRRGLRFREQDVGYDMMSGRRDITIGLIQDSDEKIGSIPVKTIDITKGIERKDVSGTEGMTFPNLYAFFQPKEGMPDIQGFVSGEIRQGEEEKVK
jgi:hypothetical protein